MPPKKKCTHKARKAELVFLERPREGPVHCYETPLPSAKKPRRVLTKPVDQNTSAWVCPQFETTKSVVLKPCQKKHYGPHKAQNQDANHSSLHAGGACRRGIACKFPPLAFENPEGYAVHPSDHPNGSRKNTQRSHNQPKKGTAAKANVRVNSLQNCREIPLLPVPQPVEPEVFSLPDAETPQVPPIRNWNCSSTLPQTSSHAWHPEKELAFGIDPSERGESAAVLVTDTPEHEYGVKVTWRQRPHLMKYLLETGKLSAADILVKANPELSRRQDDV
nr:PREDICTED: RAD9, HUS1, RAD1-interacting nuclear orphan protein 1 [Balearica regulorum gibbericeps]